MIYHSLPKVLEQTELQLQEAGWVNLQVLPESPDNIIIVSGVWQPLTRMFYTVTCALAQTFVQA